MRVARTVVAMTQPTPPRQAPVITDNRVEQRFEAAIGGDLAGYLDYRRLPGRITLPHTLVEPAFEGRGVGSALVRYALDAVRAEGGMTVVPVCSFVADWIDRHPDYADLLD